MSLSVSPATDTAALIAAAMRLIGTPYQLGGRRAHNGLVQFGLDCSEFTAWCFEQIGISLPWNAQQQYEQSVLTSQPQPGDLVFFAGTDPTDPSYITHVGLYVGGGEMVNAQDNGVQIASLSSPYWRSHLVGYGLPRGSTSGVPTGTPLAVGGAVVPQALHLPTNWRDPWVRLVLGLLAIGLIIDGVLLLFAPQIAAGGRAVLKYGKYVVAA